MQCTSDSLPISGLQHILYCPRQCALIHIERLWAENLYTAEGRILHERADEGGCENRKGKLTQRSVHVYSQRYGIHGIADVVEYTRQGKNLIPHPVEYKRGKPKKYHEDEVQLCAQALCLEEMHGTAIGSGELFYGKTRRRVEVAFDDELRSLTEATIGEFRELLRRGQTPCIGYSSRCDHCSLLDLCVPHAQRLKRGVAAWNDRMFENVLNESTD